MSKTNNIAVKICFLGAAYHGFQRQQNALTIQEIIEEALFKILGETTIIYGCSRTDAGVSANEYVFNFKTENPITPYKLKGALNHFLPNDIAVLECVRVDDDFHARYSTSEKEYIYKIINSKQKNPFTFGRAFNYGITQIDEKKLDRAAKFFLGKHDFSAFCSVNDGAKSHTRCVTHAEVTRDGDEVVFKFRADGFLYNMVRIMVGTLLFVSEEKIKETDITDIIKSRDRKRAGFTAESCGLYLNRVIYEEDPFKEKNFGGDELGGNS